MRLIDADALKFTHGLIRSKEDGHIWNELCITKDEIEDTPTVDAVTVIRCKDCKNWTEWENGAGSCQRSGSVMWLGTDATDFCSFAERKDNG